MLQDSLAELLLEARPSEMGTLEAANQVAMVLARNPSWLMDQLNVVEPSSLHKSLNPSHFAENPKKMRSKLKRAGIIINDAEPTRIAPPDRPNLSKLHSRGFTPKGVIAKMGDVSGLTSPQARKRARDIVDTEFSRIRSTELSDDMAKGRIGRQLDYYTSKGKAPKMVVSLDDARRAQDVTVQTETLRDKVKRLQTLNSDDYTVEFEGKKHVRASKPTGFQHITEVPKQGAKLRVGNPAYAAGVRYSPFDVIQSRVAQRSSVTPIDTLRVLSERKRDKKVMAALATATEMGKSGEDAIKFISSELGPDYAKSLRAAAEGTGGIVTSNPIGVGTKGAKAGIRSATKGLLAAAPVVGSAIDVGLAIDEFAEGDYDDALGHVLDAGIGLVPGADLLLNAPVMLFTDYDGAGTALVDLLGGDID